MKKLLIIILLMSTIWSISSARYMNNNRCKEVYQQVHDKLSVTSMYQCIINEDIIYFIDIIDSKGEIVMFLTSKDKKDMLKLNKYLTKKIKQINKKNKNV